MGNQDRPEIRHAGAVTVIFNSAPFLSDAGDLPVPGKPQYVRGGDIFTCTVCGLVISSHSYIGYSYFEKAFYAHMMTQHNAEIPERYRSEIERDEEEMRLFRRQIYATR
jgi:hypothetical protein